MRNIDAEAYALLHDLWLDLKEMENDDFISPELTDFERKWIKKLKKFFKDIYEVP